MEGQAFASRRQRGKKHTHTRERWEGRQGGGGWYHILLNMKQKKKKPPVLPLLSRIIAQSHSGLLSTSVSLLLFIYCGE